MRTILVIGLACLALLAVPNVAASHNCVTVFSLPSVAGVFRCDEDDNGSFERTELRSSFVPGGTIVALGLHETGAYLTSPQAGLYAGYQHTRFGGYTYDCAAAFVANQPVLVLCDVQHDWQDSEGNAHTCHRISTNLLPPQEVDCPPPA